MPRSAYSLSSDSDQYSINGKTRRQLSGLQIGFIIAAAVLALVIIALTALVAILFVNQANNGNTKAPVITTITTTIPNTASTSRATSKLSTVASSSTTKLTTANLPSAAYQTSFVDYSNQWTTSFNNSNIYQGWVKIYTYNINIVVNGTYPSNQVSNVVLSQYGSQAIRAVSAVSYVQVSFSLTILQNVTSATSVAAVFNQTAHNANYNWGQIDVNLITTTAIPTTTTTPTTAKPTLSPPVSNSTGWQAAAQTILSNMDTTANPCTDFYQYACGGFIKKHPIPANHNSYGTFTMVRDQVTAALAQSLGAKIGQTNLLPAVQKAVNSYSICINAMNKSSTNIQALLNLLTQLNNWPIITPGWNKNVSSLVAILAGYLQGDQALGTVFTSYAQTDWKNIAGNQVVYIDQASLYLRAAKYYLQSQFQVNIQSYTQLIFNQAYLLSQLKKVNVSNSSLLSDAHDIVNFETKLASISVAQNDPNRRNYSLMYNPLQISAMTQKWPNVNWQEYFLHLLPASVLPKNGTGYPLAPYPNMTVIVQEPGYMTQLNSLLETTSQRTLTNYLLWRLVGSQSYFLSEPFRIELMKFKKVHEFVNALPPIETACVNLIKGPLTFSFGRIFVDEGSFDADAKSKVNNIIGSLINSYQGMVDGLIWMDNTTKNHANQKAQGMYKNAGYPNWIMNDTLLNQYYSELNIYGNESFYKLSAKLNKFLMTKQFEAILKPSDRSQFNGEGPVFGPATVNAWYIPWLNSITFPAGILQPPFFRKDFPMAINYGAIGAVIGHEITHGFDDEGVQFYINGTLYNWMSPQSDIGFKGMASCVIDEYNNFCYPELGICINGVQTQGENIADNGGIREAFHAYINYIQTNGAEPRLPGLQNFSMKQVFFLSFASFWCGSYNPDYLQKIIITNPHSPPMFRVFGTLRNFDEFGKAFQCKIGDPYYPKRPDICYVWESPPVSRTAGYIKAANQIKSYMDPTADPCQNFYQYTCGNFANLHPVNSTSMFSSTFNLVEKQLVLSISSSLLNLNVNNTSLPQALKTTRQIFDSCTTSSSDQTSKNSQLLKILQSFGGMPVLSQSWNASNSIDIGVLAGLLQSQYGVSSIFSPLIWPDFHNPSSRILILDQGPLYLSAKEYYLNTTPVIFPEAKNKYQTLILKTLTTLSDDLNNSIPFPNLLDGTLKIVATESTLATLITRSTLPYMASINLTQINNKMNLTTLMATYPNIPWISYLQHSLPASISRLYINQSKPVVITYPSFVAGVNKLLSRATPENIYNYLFWRLIASRLQFLDQKTQSLHYSLQRFIGNPQPQFTASSCVELLVSKLEFSIGRVFAQQWALKNYTQGVTTMLNSLELAYSNNLRSIDWLDAGSLAALQEKISHVKNNVGFPAWIMNDSALNLYYQTLNVSRSQTFWDVYNQLQSWWTANEAYKLIKPTSRNSFFNRSPALLNAWFVRSYNSITIPAAMLSFPMYSPLSPNAVNFGISGYVMGHELGHAFDDVGIQFFSNGSITSQTVLSPFSRKNFNSMGQCLVKQYSQYCYNISGSKICINGTATESENMADNSGIKRAYESYWTYIRSIGQQDDRLPGLENFNLDKIFFMSLGNIMCDSATMRFRAHQVVATGHSPWPVRLTASLSNFPTFSKTFKCPAGSPMNPKNQCTVWDNKVNNSFGFQAAAKQIRSAINPKLNPCSDFYQFSCGNWKKANPLQPHQSIVNPKIQLQQSIASYIASVLKATSLNISQTMPAVGNATIYFQGCKNYLSSGGSSNLSELTQLVNKFGGWPALNSSWNANNFDLHGIVLTAGKLATKYGVKSLIAPAIEEDWLNKTKYSLELSPGSLAVPAQWYSNPAFQNSLKSFTQKVAKVIQTLSNFVGGNSTLNATEAYSEAVQIVNFEKQIAQLISPSYGSPWNFTALYNPYYLGQLNNTYPSIFWTGYLNAILPNTSLPLYNSNQQYIVLSDPGYFAGLDGILPYVQPRQTASYLMYRLVAPYLKYFSAFQSIELDFLRETEGVTALTPADIQCGQNIIRYFPEVAGRIYVDKYKPNMLITQSILNSTKSAFREIVAQLPWLDASSTQSVQAKIADVASGIGYPLWIKNNTLLNSYYSSINLTMGMSYMTMIETIQSFSAQFAVPNILNVPIRNDFYHYSAASTTAFYNYLSNSVIVSAGLLQAPMFNAYYPYSINYGGLGSSLGHVLGHGFDQLGVQFSVGGKLVNLLDSSSMKGFQSMAGCLANQYSNYCYPGLNGTCINGSNVINHIIAEGVGVKSAYFAYKAWEYQNGEEAKLPGLQYTPEQVFFISYAGQYCENQTPQHKLNQIHSGCLPADWRVKGAVSNLESFGKTFQCSRGISKMQPAKQCNVWSDPVGKYPGYKAAASQIKANANLTADPCKDFYQFSCGNYIATAAPNSNVISQSENQIAAIIQHQLSMPQNLTALQKAQQVFQSCMAGQSANQNNTKLLALLHSLGDWPIITQSWSPPSGFVPSQLAAQLLKNYGIQALLTTVVSSDLGNPSNNILYINQGSLSFGVVSLYNQTKYQASLKNEITNVANMLAKNAGVDPSSLPISSDSGNIVAFETKLAALMTPFAQQRNITKLYNKIPYNVATANWTNVNLKSYLTNVLKTTELSAVTASGLVIESPNFLKGLDLLLSQYATSPKIVVNYLLWRLVKRFYNNRPPSTAQSCTFGPTGLASTMPFAVERIYRSTVGFESLLTISLLTKGIVNGYAANLNTVPWLDTSSQAAVINKINSTANLLGPSPLAKNDTALEKYYSELSFSDNSSWTVSLALSEFVSAKQFALLLQSASPSKIAAYQNYYDPILLTQQPFFRPDFPMALNYGSFGATIAYLLGYQINDMAVQINSNGALQQVMSPAAQTGFNSMVQCLVNEYNSFCFPGTSPCVNGRTVVGAAIAEGAGLAASYTAYKSYVSRHGEEDILPGLTSYTMEQIFFISYAQRVCQKQTNELLQFQLALGIEAPEPYHINGAVQNFPAFSKAFSCAAKTSAMNPVSKCNVWNRPVGQTSGWKSMAAQFNTNMDNTVSPCQNFFQYACGGFLKNQKIPLGGSGVSNVGLQAVQQITTKTYTGLQKIVTPSTNWPQSLQKARMAFDSCMSTQGNASLSNVMALNKVMIQYGTFPPLNKQWNSSQFNAYKFMAFLSNASINTLLTPWVDTNWTFPHLPAFYIDQATLGLSSRWYYINSTFESVRQRYKKFMADAITLLANDVNVQIDSGNLNLDVNQIFTFETSIAQYTVPSSQRRSYSAMYNPTTILNASQTYTNLNLRVFIQALLPPSTAAQVLASQFMINEPGYLKNLDGIVVGRDRTVAMYLMWRLLYANLPFMGNNYRDLIQEFRKTLHEYENIPDMTQECTYAIIGGMPYAAGRVYIDNGFNKQSVQIVSGMISSVLNAFQNMLSQLSWVDSQTLAGAYGKVANLTKNVGFPPFILNNTLLDVYYRDLLIGSSQTPYFTLQQRMTNHQSQMQWARLRVTTDRNFFGGTPAMVNAWYQPELNSITFPAGILQPPFFSYDRPMAANFGGIGIVMGHELSHGFDDQGVQFDGLGYMRNWMDPNTTIGFLNMANCVINEYSQYCFPNLTLPVKCINGRNTQGENIADNGGMQAAFHAYQNWVKANGQEASLPGFEKYSMEKVFFLNFGNIWCSKLTPNALERHLLGDPHSPAVARVTESLRNFPLFGQTFGCKPGDFMYPTQGTCTVW